MIYNVHIYREMRLKFDGIKAATPEAAAEIARDKPTDQADEIDDCDGVTLTALVDEAGDDEYERSVTIDFECERERKAAAEMLIALRAFIEADQMAEECGEWKWENLYHAFALARAAIAEATNGSPSQPAKPIVIEVRGGMVQDVQNVPPGYQYEIRDYDNLEADLPQHIA